jgi:putative glutamine amidotransferase|tara:strand:- start:320 stop:874 length:555 start_codon:yes stop_codon:yes gene_type:complete
MRIGLTQRVFEQNKQSYDATDQDWYTYFSDHELVQIPNDPTQDFISLADSLDLLVITGGNSPAKRVKTELELVRCMMNSTKPVLGICHGAFLLTDLFGGEVVECSGHHNTVHNVIMDNSTVEVNSFHNLQIKTPPANVKVLAVDEDGFCESWTQGTIAAIVWHPERGNVTIPHDIKLLLNVNLK